MLTRQIFLSIALFVGLSSAFIEELIDATPPADEDDIKILNFNKEMVRCLTIATQNVSASGYEGALATCCLRDYWSVCIRAGPLAKECTAVLEARVEEFETSMVNDVDCSTIDARRCPHVPGHKDRHLTTKERSQRFTGATSSVDAGFVPAVLAIVLVVKNMAAARIL